jgi:F0F1-type ATP synthase assembly protein I
MARGLTLAFEFTGAVVVFWLIGRWIDGWFGIGPWAQIVGSVVGWVGGFLHLYYKVQRLDDMKPGEGPKAGQGTKAGRE